MKRTPYGEPKRCIICGIKKEREHFHDNNVTCGGCLAQKDPRPVSKELTYIPPRHDSVKRALDDLDRAWPEPAPEQTNKWGRAIDTA